MDKASKLITPGDVFARYIWDPLVSPLLTGDGKSLKPWQLKMMIPIEQRDVLKRLIENPESEAAKEYAEKMRGAISRLAGMTADAATAGGLGGVALGLSTSRRKARSVADLPKPEVRKPRRKSDGDDDSGTKSADVVDDFRAGLSEIADRMTDVPDAFKRGFGEATDEIKNLPAAIKSQKVDPRDALTATYLGLPAGYAPVLALPAAALLARRGVAKRIESAGDRKRRQAIERRKQQLRREFAELMAEQITKRGSEGGVDISDTVGRLADAYMDKSAVNKYLNLLEALMVLSATTAAGIGGYKLREKFDKEKPRYVAMRELVRRANADRQQSSDMDLALRAAGRRYLQPTYAVEPAGDSEKKDKKEDRKPDYDEALDFSKLSAVKSATLGPGLHDIGAGLANWAGKMRDSMTTAAVQNLSDADLAKALGDISKDRAIGVLNTDEGKQLVSSIIADPDGRKVLLSQGLNAAKDWLDSKGVTKYLPYLLPVVGGGLLAAGMNTVDRFAGSRQPDAGSRQQAAGPAWRGVMPGPDIGAPQVPAYPQQVAYAAPQGGSSWYSRPPDAAAYGQVSRDYANYMRDMQNSVAANLRAAGSRG